MQKLYEYFSSQTEERQCKIYLKLCSKWKMRLPLFSGIYLALILYRQKQKIKVMKNIILFISTFAALSRVYSLNSYIEEKIVLNKTVSCMKYIPNYQLLALAQSSSTIQFLNLTTNSTQFASQITTSGPVLAMFTLSDNSTLIFAQKNKISAYDYGKMAKPISLGFLIETVITAIPWGKGILVQLKQEFYNFAYKTCYVQFSSDTIKCSSRQFSFSYVPTNFLKVQPFNMYLTGFVFRHNLNRESIHIQSNSTGIKFYVASNVTDLVFSAVARKKYIFTQTKSVYTTTYSGSPVYSQCFTMDFDTNIMNEATISVNQDIFWYITDQGAVKGRDYQTLDLAYQVKISKAIELEPINVNQDLIVRTSDNFVYVLRTEAYTGKNTRPEFFKMCADGVTPSTADTTSNTTTSNNTQAIQNQTDASGTNQTMTQGTNQTSNSTSNQTLNQTTDQTQNQNQSADPQTSTANSTQPPIAQESTRYAANNITQDTKPENIFSETTLQQIQALQIFYCIENCKTCLNSDTCLICKSGFQLTQDNLCMPQASITLFSTFISAPYSGLVFNLVMMDFLDDFWFFEHHNFNYSKNLQKIFSLVGSLNRNKIVPPAFKVFLKDAVANLNPRKISSSNYLNYTKITFQRAQNTDIYFVATVSGMFVWAYILILALFILSYLLNLLLTSQFEIYALDKFSCKGAILYQMFSPFVQFVSFHAFSQMGVFFAFNNSDKVNLLFTLVFLGMMLMFVFSGFPLFFYFNPTKKVKEFYGEKQNTDQYAVSIAVGHGKFLALGFVNGYFTNYSIQCVGILLIYIFEIACIRMSIKKQNNKLIKAPIFFKLVMKILSFMFVASSIWIHLNDLSNDTSSIYHICQQLFVIGIWTWAIGDMMFKSVETIVIGIRKLKGKIESCFQKESEMFKVEQVDVGVDMKTKKSQRVTDEKIDEIITPVEYKSKMNDELQNGWNEKKRHFKRFIFRKKQQRTIESVPKGLIKRTR